ALWRARFGGSGQLCVCVRVTSMVRGLGRSSPGMAVWCSPLPSALAIINNNQNIIKLIYFQSIIESIHFSRELRQTAAGRRCGNGARRRERKRTAQDTRDLL